MLNKICGIILVIGLIMWGGGYLLNLETINELGGQLMLLALAPFILKGVIKFFIKEFLSGKW